MKAYGKSWGYNVYDCRYCLYRKGKLKGCVYPDGCCCPVPQKPARRNGIEQVYKADADSAAPVSACEGCPYGKAAPCIGSPLDKEQRAALKTERAQLEAEREALLPKLEEVKAELAELNRIRYWTRRVIPDALPRVSDGRVSVEDAMETAVNRKELEQIEDKAAQIAAHQPQEQEKTQEKQKVKQGTVHKMDG